MAVMFIVTVRFLSMPEGYDQGTHDRFRSSVCAPSTIFSSVPGLSTLFINIQRDGTLK